MLSPEMIKTLKSDLNKLKFALIILTVLELSALAILLMDSDLWRKLDTAYNTVNIVWGIHYLVVGISMWFIWTKIPYNQKTKVNHILMIVFLGIIGLWLWMPNEKEFKKIVAEFE